MALVPIAPVGNSRLAEQLALAQILGQGAQGFQGYQDRQAKLAETEALAAVLGGQPGQMTPGQLDPRNMTVGSQAGTLGTPPTAGLIQGMSPQEAQALTAAGLGPTAAKLGLEQRFAQPDDVKLQHVDWVTPEGLRQTGTFNPRTGEVTPTPHPAGPAFRPPDQTNVNVPVNLPPQESEREKVLGQGTGARFNAIQDDRRALHEEMVTNDAMVGLLDQGVQTGWTEELKARAADFGLNISGAADIKAFQALAGDVTMRNLRRIPGPASDNDIRMAAQLSARAGNSVEANRAILAVNQRIAEYRDQLLALEEQHISRTGSQQGFAEVRRAWMKDNPLNLPQIVEQVAPGILDQPVREAPGLMQQGLDALSGLTEPFAASVDPSRSPPAPPISQRVVGEIYSNPVGQRARWTGTGWELVN